MTAEQQALRQSEDAIRQVLERAGVKTWKGRNCCCPFHKDKNPSAGIYKGDDDVWRFKCHACDAAGDVFDMIARVDGRKLADVLKGAGGRFHLSRVRTRRRTITVAAPLAKDFAALAKQYHKSLTTDGLAALVKDLNVSAKSLRRVGVGWNGAGYSFPMRDEIGRVIGLRIRYPSGFKAAEKGSSNGLFIPDGLSGGGLLLICEGPTDTVAALDLGFAAVGRPSCNTGALMLTKLTRGRDVAIVGDGDAPGRRGAEQLASGLMLGCKSVRVVYPPDHIKDLRAWKAAGVTPEELRTVIDKTKRMSLTVEAKVWRRKARNHGR